MLDPVVEEVANSLQGLVDQKNGVKVAVEAAMTALLSLCDRQDLHGEVRKWWEGNAVLGMDLDTTSPTLTSTPVSCDASTASHDTSVGPSSAAPSSASSAASTHGGGVCVRPNNTPQSPPWLVHAGLPNNDTLAIEDELWAFGGFLSALPEEQSTRAYMRTSLQKLVQLLVSSEATLKMIGSWATGISAFYSDLDLVLDSPSRGGTDLQCLLKSLFDVLKGFSYDVKMVQVGNHEAVQLTALSMAAPAGAPEEPPQDYQLLDFKVNIFSDRSKGNVPADYAGVIGPAQSRTATLQLMSALSRFSIPYRRMATTLRHVLLRMNTTRAPGGLNGYCALLLIVAFMQDCRNEALSMGETFRKFFLFYSTFDFQNMAIRLVSGNQGGGNFVPRSGCAVVDPEAQLLLLDPITGSFNVAEGVTKILQVKTTLNYITVLIKRYDADSRGVSLLPNVIACTEEMKLRFNYMVRNGVIAGVESANPPSTPSTTSASPPGRFLAHPAKVGGSSVISSSSSSVLEVIEKPEIEVLVTAARQLSAFIEDSKNQTVKDEMLLNQALRNPELLTHIIVTEGHNGELWEYKGHGVKVLMEGILENEEDPLISQILRAERTVCAKLGDVVSPKIAAAAAIEAADYLEFLKAHKPEKHKSLMRELVGAGEWGTRKRFSTYMIVFQSLRRNHPNSLFRGVPEESMPVLAKILIEFSNIPEVRRHRKRAAFACVSREFVLAVQRDIHDFLTSDLHPEATDETGIAAGIAEATLAAEKTPHAFRMKFIQAHMQPNVLDELQVELLLTIASLPGSRIDDFENDADLIRYLKGELNQYSKDPEIQEIHNQIAGAITQWMLMSMQSIQS